MNVHRAPSNGKVRNGRRGNGGAVVIEPQKMPAIHQPRAEREAAGRALRDRIPRAQHARLEVAAKRDPLALIEATNESRLPDLVPIRWGRMFESPFPFYRGAPAVMAHDLAHSTTTGMMVQACGDAHLLNFGVFATAERNLVVDVNDFDETHPAPWDWDVKRLAASIVIAAREVGGISDRDGRDAAEGAVRAYREHMREIASMDPLSAYYERLDVEEAARILGRTQSFVQKRREKLARQSAETVPKLTELVGKTMRIVTRPPNIQPLPPETAEDVSRVFAEYHASLREDRRILAERWRVVDVALKVVGVGSVGTRCFIALLEADGFPLVLQVKEALPSVLAPYARGPRYDHEGRRVVVGQWIMQAAGDIFLGWARNRGRHFYVRQFRDMKMGIDVATLDPKRLPRLGQLAGRILARAHARSGDAAAIAGYLGKSDAFDLALAKLAVAYADLNEKDHALLKEAVRSGKIRALTGT